MVQLIQAAFIDSAVPEETVGSVKPQTTTAAHTPHIVDRLSTNTAGKAKRGALTNAVLTKANSLPDPFTGYELTDMLTADGFIFGAHNPAISVIDVLRKLTRKGIIRKHSEGSGSNPDRYLRKSTLFEQEGRAA